MITFTVNGQGEALSMDDQSLTFPEGLELERQTGLGASKYLQELAEGTTQSSAALIWLGAVRHTAARDGVNFRTAAQALPFAAFAETLDLMATMKTVRRAAEPDPTQPAAGPDGSAAITSPVTSEQPPEPAPSPADVVPISESSLSSSVSVPGSGTS